MLPPLLGPLNNLPPPIHQFRFKRIEFLDITGGGFRPTAGTSGNLIFPSQANIVQGPGAITGTISPMRQIQFGLKLIW